MFAGGTVAYASCMIPTYPSGTIGFMLCSKNPDTQLAAPQGASEPGPLPSALGSGAAEGAKGRLLRYYSPQVHAAAFVLPRFADEALRR